MNPAETVLFLLVGIAAMVTSFLRILTISKVNKGMPIDQQLSYSAGNWKEMKQRYMEFYPRGILYKLTVQSAVVLIVLAFIAAGFFVWEFIAGK